MNPHKLLQERLKQKLTELKAKNPRASVRSFARQMKLSPGTMSLVLLGKRKVSLATALELAKALDLDPMERTEVIQQLEQESRDRSQLRKKKSPHEKNKELLSTFRPEVYRIADEQFDVMSQWYYFGILNLVQTDDFCMNSDWIGKRLNIDYDIAREALETLVRLKFIVVDKEGKAKRSFQNIRTSDGKRNESLRRANVQGLELAIKALEKQEYPDSDFTWTILPVDFRQIEDMKVSLRNYHREFIERFGLKKGANEVVRIGIQLFPLTTVRKNSKK